MPKARLTAAQRYLAGRYLPLALSIARRYNGFSLDHDELESAALLGLTIAAGAWEEHRARFATFVRRKVSWEVLRAIRAARPAGRRDRLTPSHVSLGPALESHVLRSFSGQIPDDPAEAAIAAEEVRRFVEGLQVPGPRRRKLLGLLEAYLAPPPSPPPRPTP